MPELIYVISRFVLHERSETSRFRLAPDSLSDCISGCNGVKHYYPIQAFIDRDKANSHWVQLELDYRKNLNPIKVIRAELPILENSKFPNDYHLKLLTAKNIEPPVIPEPKGDYNSYWQAQVLFESWYDDNCHKWDDETLQAVWQYVLPNVCFHTIDEIECI